MKRYVVSAVICSPPTITVRSEASRSRALASAASSGTSALNTEGTKSVIVTPSVADQLHEVVRVRLAVRARDDRAAADGERPEQLPDGAVVHVPRRLQHARGRTPRPPSVSVIQWKRLVMPAVRHHGALGHARGAGRVDGVDGIVRPRLALRVGRVAPLADLHGEHGDAQHGRERVRPRAGQQQRRAQVVQHAPQPLLGPAARPAARTPRPPSSRPAWPRPRAARAPPARGRRRRAPSRARAAACARRLALAFSAA